MITIDPNDIHVGDLVTVTTRRGDRARGPVRLGGGNQLAVEAFGVLIPFARRGLDRATGRYTWKVIAGLAVAEQQTPLFGGGHE